jgi:hypothetical protein
VLPALTRTLDNNLGTPRRRLAGVERGARFLQLLPKPLRERVRATEHAPRDPFRVLEGRHALAEVVERGVGVQVPPDPMRLVRGAPIPRRAKVREMQNALL